MVRTLGAHDSCVQTRVDHGLKDMHDATHSRASQSASKDTQGARIVVMATSASSRQARRIKAKNSTKQRQGSLSAYSKAVVPCRIRPDARKTS